MPSTTASNAKGTDPTGGISLTKTDTPASRPMTARAVESRREGRHWSLPPNASNGGRQGADPIDKSGELDRKSTRLNSSHSQISYAVFCLKKKKKQREHNRYEHNS